MTDPAKRREDIPPVPGDDSAPRTSSGITDGNLARSMELHDFMEGLGFVFQLPMREAATPAPRAPAARARPGTRLWVLVTGIGLAAAAALYVLWAPTASDALPSGALGRWVATDPRYADRGFDLDTASIVFHTGARPGDLTQHSIRGIKVRNDQGKRIVTVEYALEEGSMSFAFWLQTSGAPVIRLVNQPDIVWRRAGP